MRGCQRFLRPSPECMTIFDSKCILEMSVPLACISLIPFRLVQRYLLNIYIFWLKSILGKKNFKIYHGEER